MYSRHTQQTAKPKQQKMPKYQPRRVKQARIANKTPSQKGGSMLQPQQVNQFWVQFKGRNFRV